MREVAVPRPRAASGASEEAPSHRHQQEDHHHRLSQGADLLLTRNRLSPVQVAVEGEDAAFRSDLDDWVPQGEVNYPLRPKKKHPSQEMEGDGVQ